MLGLDLVPSLPLLLLSHGLVRFLLLSRSSKRGREGRNPHAPNQTRLANLYSKAGLAIGASDPCVRVSDHAAFPAALEILAAGGKELGWQLSENISCE